MDLAFLSSLARYRGHASGRSLDVGQDDQLLLLGIPPRRHTAQALRRGADGRLQPVDRDLRRLLVRLGGLPGIAPVARPPQGRPGRGRPDRLRRQPRRSPRCVGQPLRRATSTTGTPRASSDPSSSRRSTNSPSSPSFTRTFTRTCWPFRSSSPPSPSLTGGWRRAPRRVRAGGSAFCSSLSTAGTARAASLWNMPAIAILLVVCGRSARDRRRAAAGPARRGPRRASPASAVFAASLVLFYPYTASFELENKGLGRTTMFSGALRVPRRLGNSLRGRRPRALAARAPRRRRRARRRRDLALTLAARRGVSLAGSSCKMPAMPLVLSLAFLAARAGLEEPPRPRRRTPDGVFAAFLVLLGLGMMAGCEFVYFKDSYGQDLQRMNTIFKFYHQAWPLLGDRGAVFAGRAWDAARADGASPSASPWPRARSPPLLWPVNVGDLAVPAEGRPVLARRPRSRSRAAAPADAAAIDWLTKNAPRRVDRPRGLGGPLHGVRPHLVAHRDPDGARLGQPRGPLALQRPRGRRAPGAGQAFYTTPDVRAAWDTLQKYGVTHVVVGDMERRTYRAPNRRPPFPFLTPVLRLGRNRDLHRRAARKMKILMAIDYYRPNVSGLTLYVEHLAEGLVRRGHDVRVLTHRHLPELPARERRERRDASSAPRWPLRVGQGARRRRRSWRGRSPSCPARTSSTSTPRSSTRCRSRSSAATLRVPIVVTYHCDLQPPPSRGQSLVDVLARASQHFALERADRVITYTEDYARNTRPLRRPPGEGRLDPAARHRSAPRPAAAPTRSGRATGYAAARSCSSSAASPRRRACPSARSTAFAEVRRRFPAGRPPARRRQARRRRDGLETRRAAARGPGLGPRRARHRPARRDRRPLRRLRRPRSALDQRDRVLRPRPGRGDAVGGARRRVGPAGCAPADAA